MNWYENVVRLVHEIFSAFYTDTPMFYDPNIITTDSVHPSPNIYIW